jgi:hypothetical protein
MGFYPTTRKLIVRAKARKVDKFEFLQLVENRLIELVDRLELPAEEWRSCWQDFQRVMPKLRDNQSRPAQCRE